MNVFAQGMRRSGTTLVFDLFLEDGRFQCWYEPLAAGKPTMGGGSGAHQFDLFENVRAARDEFARRRTDLPHVSVLNHGAPRDPTLELEPRLPEVVRSYLRHLVSRSTNTFMKFTRMAHKVEHLAHLDPEAKLLHVVRDPRSVAVSYLFGRDAKNRHRFPDADTFFRRVSNASAWSSRPHSDSLLARPEYQHLAPCPDHLRILLLWKENFRAVHAHGKRCFGENYLLMRHEDLRSDPDRSLDALYAFLGRQAPDRVRTWLHEHIAPLRPHPWPHDPRWQESFELISLQDELTAAGYPFAPGGT